MVLARPRLATMRRPGVFVVGLTTPPPGGPPTSHEPRSPHRRPRPRSPPQPQRRRRPPRTRPRRGAMDPYMEERFVAEPTPFVERLPVQLAVPADRRLRLPVGLPHRRARRARRHRRVAVPAALRRPERLRRDPRPQRRRLPPRARASMGVPAGRRYEPGTNILETTWMTPTGWLVVRDALIIGRWRERTAGLDDRAHAPADRLRGPPRASCARSPASTARRRSRLLCEPMFDYGRVPAEWSRGARATRSPSTRPAPTASALRLISDLRPRHRGRPSPAPATASRRARRASARCRWSRLLDGPRSVREAERRAADARASTGAAGWPTASSPTTAGAATSQRSALSSRA